MENTDDLILSRKHNCLWGGEAGGGPSLGPQLTAAAPGVPIPFSKMKPGILRRVSFLEDPGAFWKG